MSNSLIGLFFVLVIATVLVWLLWQFLGHPGLH